MVNISRFSYGLVATLSAGSAMPNVFGLADDGTGDNVPRTAFVTDRAEVEGDGDVTGGSVVEGDEDWTREVDGTADCLREVGKEVVGDTFFSIFTPSLPSSSRTVSSSAAAACMSRLRVRET